MKNLDRLLEKSRELRDSQADGDSCIAYMRHLIATNADVDEMLILAVEALEKMISISMPLYEGEDIFYPALQALRKIEALAAKALGEK